MRARRLLGAAVVLVAAAVPTDVAHAVLRPTPLMASCATGFTYQERVVGPFRVEGCRKEVDPASRNELTRYLYKGAVEVNGMVLEGSTDLELTKSLPKGVLTQRQAHTAITETQKQQVRLKRAGSDTRLVFDNVNGARDVVHRGPINLHGFDLDTNHFDVPLDSDAKVRGMRLRQPKLNDVEFVAGGSAGHPGESSFKAKLSFGATAAQLLRDWTHPSQFRLVDGTGLVLNDLKFELPQIVVPGIGGLKDLKITYDKDTNTWTGTVKLDMGEMFPSVDFSMTVNAATGAPTRIETQVSGLTIPVGNTGITIRGFGGFFQPNPLVFGANVGATWGLRIGGFYLVEIDGEIEIALEPAFRLEVGGSARVLPSGPNAQLARGSAGLILDSRGYFAVNADARVDVRENVFLLGEIGATGQAKASGAFSTVSDKFNIGGELRGTIHAGFAGDLDAIVAKAVISDKGWGACGSLLEIITAGVGQKWRQPLDLFFNCDLGRYESVVPDPGARQADDVVDTRTFRVAPNTQKILVQVTGTEAEPRLQLQGPAGQSITTLQLGQRRIGENVAVVAQPGARTQLIGIRNPPAGAYTLRSQSALTEVKIARSVPNVTANLSVVRGTKPGQRRLRVAKLRNLLANEEAEFVLRTAQGDQPVEANSTFEELTNGVAKLGINIYRDGIPIPLRSRTFKTYVPHLPERPIKVSHKVKKNVATLEAKVAEGKEKPDAWQYVLRSNGAPFAATRAKPGKQIKLTIPSGTPGISVSVRPILNGRVLATAERTTKL